VPISKKTIAREAHKLKKTIKQPVQRAAKDWSFFFAFPREYLKAIESVEINERKVLFIDGKADSDEVPDAFSLMMPYLQEHYDMDVRYVGLGQNARIGWLPYYKRCLRLMHDMADARFVFLADASDVVSCVPLREGTEVVQLWHACGAFKKFGVSTADLMFGGTRKQVERHPFYKNLSLVTVSAPEVEWAYREAMMLEDTPEVVRGLGVSRTDVFFDESYLAAVRREMEQLLPVIGERKVILYAPTFRGWVGHCEGPDELDIAAMREALGDEYVLLVKHHPFVKKLPPIPESCSDFAVQANAFPIDWLLTVSDVCISDYSSIVFEYSLFARPMVFFAYDKDDYDDWRGFYYDYDEMTPGPVVKTTEEVIDYIKHLDERFDSEAVAAFREKFMSACDGHATERIGDYVMSRVSS